MGAGRPFRAKASYMSVQSGSSTYRYRQELSQSSRGSANGARPRTRQFALPGPNPIIGERAPWRRLGPHGRMSTIPGVYDI